MTATPPGRLICRCTFPTSPFPPNGAPAHYVFLLFHSRAPRFHPDPFTDPRTSVPHSFFPSLLLLRPLPAVASTHVCFNPPRHILDPFNHMYDSWIPSVSSHTKAWVEERWRERVQKMKRKQKRPPLTLVAGRRRDVNSGVGVRDKGKWRRAANERC